MTFHLFCLFASYIGPHLDPWFLFVYLFLIPGAETPVYVALLPPNINEPRGRFLRNKEISTVKQGC